MKMRDQFVMIKNAKRFQFTVDHIHHKLKGMERMALVFGDPGLGKTETALQYAAQNGSLYIRMKKLMNARWFLRQLAQDLGGAYYWRTMDLFDEAVRLLSRENKRTLILDEVDYFTADSKVTETIRDLHDITGTPMIFIGMQQADKRLMRYPHLYDRFVEIVKFMPLDREDVEKMTKELSEIQFSDDAINQITHDSEGKIRKVLALIHRAEYIAKGSKNKTIEARDLK
jgi:DNA transposition AAA+ family ATPase